MDARIYDSNFYGVGVGDILYKQYEEYKAKEKKMGRKEQISNLREGVLTLKDEVEKIKDHISPKIDHALSRSFEFRGLPPIRSSRLDTIDKDISYIKDILNSLMEHLGMEVSIVEASGECFKAVKRGKK